MKAKILEKPYGIYCLVLYRTIFGVPYYFRAVSFNNYDAMLDYYNMNKKTSNISELMKQKETLEKQLDKVRRELRELINSKSDKVK